MTVHTTTQATVTSSSSSSSSKNNDKNNTTTRHAESSSESHSPQSYSYQYHHYTNKNNNKDQNNNENININNNNKDDDNNNNNNNNDNDKSRMNYPESLLAQALEVPSLNHQNTLDNDDDDETSNLSVLSASHRSSSTPHTSHHHFPMDSSNSSGIGGAGLAPDVLLPRHSDYTIPTSNIVRHVNNHNNKLSHHGASNNATKQTYFPTSPPAEITPQKRRNILGNNVKSRYYVRPKPDTAAIYDTTPPNDTTRRQQQQQNLLHHPHQVSYQHHPLAHSDRSMSPPHSPSITRNIHSNSTPVVVSPLTPFDRNGNSSSHRRYSSKYIPTTPDHTMDPTVSAIHPDIHHTPHKSKKKRLHETIHAQSLLIGLAFMAIWSPNNIMAPNLTQMATTTFHMTNDERDLYLGSYCALAVGVFSFPISALVGFMVDFYSRKRLFVFCLIGGSVATAWTAASTTFWNSLFLARIVTGGFMSASVPVAFSLLGDLFSTEERNAASSGLTAMMGMGILLGQVYSGVVGPSLGWQHPFWVSTVMSLFSAVTIAIWVQEPDRGAKEKVLQEMLRNGSKYERKLTWKGFVHAMQSNMSNKILLWSGFFTSLPWGIVFVFLNDYLSQEKGFSVPDATFMVMLFGIGTAIGGISGGYLGQRLQEYNQSYVPLYMAASTFLGVVPFLALLNSKFPNHHGYKAMIYSILAGTIASLPSVNVRPCILNVNPPETRGAALTAANLLVALGRGIGPSCITILGSVFSVTRQTAFNTTLLLFWTITAIQLLFLAKCLPEDQDKMEAELAQYAATAAGQCNMDGDEGATSSSLVDENGNGGGMNIGDLSPIRQAELTPLQPQKSPLVLPPPPPTTASSMVTSPMILRHSSDSRHSTNSTTNVLFDDGGSSLVSMEEYITSFDGNAARRSFQLVQQGIHELKEEMTCMTCGGGNSSASSSEFDETSPGDLERRKEAWKRRQQLSFSNEYNSSDDDDDDGGGIVAKKTSTDKNTTTTAEQRQEENTKGSSSSLPPNETTPLMLV